MKSKTCAACGGQLQRLGSLGSLKWFRCRNCGLDQSKKSATKKAKATK